MYSYVRLGVREWTGWGLDMWAVTCKDWDVYKGDGDWVMYFKV